MKTKNRLVTFLKTVLIAFALSFGVNAYAKDTSGTDAAMVQDSQAQTESAVICAETASDTSAGKQESLIEKGKAAETNETKESEAIASDSLIEGNDNDSSSRSAVKTEEKSEQKTDKKSSGEEVAAQKSSNEQTTDSKYTVEFTHKDLQYVLEGGKSVKLAKILEKVKIEGENIEKVECSDESLFSASKKSGEWIVSSHKPFSSQEWMKVTVDGKLYNITVTDATSGSCGTNMTWSLVGNTLYVKGTSSSATMSNAANEGTSIFSGLNKADVKCIILGDYVTNIGNYALSNFPNLEVVSIPDTVTGSGKIGTQAFVYIPTTAHICYWGSSASSARLTTACGGSLANAFPNTPSANFHYLTNSIGYTSSDKVYYAFDSGNTTAYISGKGEMQNWNDSSNRSPFYSNKSTLVTAIICGENVDIGQYAFCECSNLTYVYIHGNTLNKVCDHAFNSCTYLYKITLPDSVTVIGRSAFTSCSNLKNLAWNDGGNIARLPDSIDEIGEYGFYKCQSLKTVLCPSTISSLGNRAFARNSGDGNLKFYYWGENAEAAKLAPKCSGGITNPATSNVFRMSDSSATLCDFYYQAKEIGATKNWVYAVATEDDAYCYIRKWPKGSENTGIIRDFDATSSGDQNLSNFLAKNQKVVIAEGITVIGYNVFSLGNCGMEDLTLPNTLTTIKEYVFQNCASLPYIKIPSSVTSIGLGALWGSTKNIYYANVESEKSDPEASLTAKCGGDLGKCFEFLDGNAVFHYKCGEGLWYTFNSDKTTVTISKGLESTGSAMWTYSSQQTPFYANASTLTTANISDATTVGRFAFRSCTNLANVTFSSSVTKLCNSCFKQTGFTSMVIPDTVTDLSEEGIFWGCSNLASVTIPTGVTSNIGVSAFKNLKSGAKIYYRNADSGTAKTNPEAYLASKCDGGVISGSFSTDRNYEFYYRCGDTLWYTFNSDNTTVTISKGPDTTGSAMWDYSSQQTPFYANASTLTTANISDATTVGTYAFRSCTNLANVTFSSSVTKLCNSSFKQTGFTSIVIPDTITDLSEEGIFWGCGSLASVTIPAGVTSIGDVVFKNLASGADIYYVNDYNHSSDPVGDLESKCYTNGTDTNGKIYNSFNYTVDSDTAGHYVFHFKCGDHLWYSITSGAVTIVKDDTTQSSYPMWNWTDPTATSAVPSPFYTARATITSLSINDATSIGDYAFHYCTSLQGALTIPNNVTSIGDFSFANCTGLTVVSIPNSVTSMRTGVFYSCSSLRTANIPTGITAVPATTFYNCTYLQNITIPENITSIYAEAFRGCLSLTTITIPNSVTDIYSAAFSYCNGASTIKLSCNATVIMADAFSNTKAEAEFYCLNAYSKESLGELCRTGSTATGQGISYAFGNYANQHFYFQCGDNLWYEFSGTNDTKATILAYPSDATDTTMWDWAPNDTTHPTPSPFATIQNNDTYALTEIDFGDATTIGSYAFNGCADLGDSLTIPSTIVSIGDYAFNDCAGVENVNIPSSITSIGDSAFVGLYASADIYYNNTFATTSNPEGDLSGKCATSLASSFGNTNTYVFHYKCGDHLWYSITSGTVTIVKDDTTQSSYPMWNWTAPTATSAVPSPFYTARAAITSLSISDATSIGDNAFRNCTSLQGALTIPNSVTSIGESSFRQCSSLTAVSIPNPVTSMGTWVFYNCTNLRTANIPTGITAIPDYTFYECTYLENITIPGNITSIGAAAFRDCNYLTSITIPESVTNIKGQAFMYCNRLSTIKLSRNATVIMADAFSNTKTGAEFYCLNAYSKESLGELCRTGSTATGQGISYAFGNYANQHFYFQCGDNLWYELSGTNDTKATILAYPSDATDTTMWDWAPNDATHPTPSPFVTIQTNDTYALTEIDFGGATSVGSNAFNGCSGLSGTLTLPSNITTVGTGAFYGCSGLTNIVIPTSITANSAIGSSAFKNLGCTLSTPAVVNIFYAGKQAVFTPLCTTSIINCFDYGVGASNNLLYHFIQDIIYMDGETAMTGLVPTLYETNSDAGTVVLPTPSKPTSEFEGWYTDPSCDTARVYSITTDNTQFGDVTFYSKWRLTSRRIIYYCQYGSITSPSVTEYVPGSGLTLTLDKPTRTGYAFCGWYSSDNVTFTETYISAEEKLVDEYIGTGTLTFEVGQNDQDVEFYAKWYQREAITYWENGQSKVLSSSTLYDVIKPCETTIGTLGQTTWYVLTDDVYINSGVSNLTVLGDVKIILKDNCSLIGQQLCVDAPNSVTIYAQQSDDVYRMPLDMSGVVTKGMSLLSSEYYWLNNRRYYWNQISGDGTAYLYDDKNGIVYKSRYDFDSSQYVYDWVTPESKIDILAIPKSHTASTDYTDDNDVVYVWNSEDNCYETEDGNRVYKFYQEDSSTSGYRYWLGPYPEFDVIDEITLEPNYRSCYFGYYFTKNNDVYYLDHDDAISPPESYEGHGGDYAIARTGDYIYSPDNSDKKYYYVTGSFANTGNYSFSYTDGTDTEQLTGLSVVAQETCPYVDDEGKRYFATRTEDDDLILVDPTSDENGRYKSVFGDLIYRGVEDLGNDPKLPFIKKYLIDADASVTFNDVVGIMNFSQVGSSGDNISSGAITIYGGKIYADWPAVGHAAIGSGAKTESQATVITGDINIYGGEVITVSDYSQGTIGGGDGVSGGTIAIHGGRIITSHIGAGDNISNDTTNLSISWTHKTDYIKLSDCAKTSDFLVDSTNKFLLAGECMIDASSVINSKSDLPATGSAYLLPYYPMDYMLIIPRNEVLPFRFSSGKFGADDSDSMSLEPGEDDSGATYPYGLSVIISKTHFAKITGKDSGGNNIYDASQTLEYSLKDYETDKGVVNKCLIISNGNDHINYKNGSECTLGGSNNMNISVNNMSKWATLSSGVYGSAVTFTVGLSTIGSGNPFLLSL